MSISSLSGQIFESTLNGKGFVTKRVSKFMSKQFDKAMNDPARFASQMLVTSIVSKDAVGCVIYTTQSLHNEKIPKDKRASVASLDLMNGGLMVGGQLLVGKIIDAKLTPQLFGKMYSGFFKDKHTGQERILDGVGARDNSRLFEDNLEKVVREKAKKLAKTGEKVDVKKIVKALGKEIGRGTTRFKLFEAGFGIVVTALATTALVKRTIVPFIATPLSGWFKNNFIEDQPKNKDDLKLTPAMVDSTMPKVGENKPTLNKRV